MRIDLWTEDFVLLTHCAWCDAPLKGSWTIHASDCPISELIAEYFPSLVACERSMNCMSTFLPSGDVEKSAICSYCTEPILPHEVCNQPGFHHECVFRAVAGSVAHIEHRCSCYVPSSTENDPEGMTLREAARAAVEAWRRNEAMRIDL